MRIFAVSDLHLPGGQQKPMDVFGSHWQGHFSKISADWQARVSEEDVVLLPGDLSWAMKLEDASKDLDRIGALPGHKIILRGNHDYWWSSLTKLRAVLPKNMYALQNDTVKLQDTVFCGTRGWTLPEENDAENRKIFDREVMRLTLSMDAAQRIPAERIVALCHYPPVNEKGEDNPFVQKLLNCDKLTDVVYGHLHGPAFGHGFQGMLGKTRFHCVSCDGLNFRLLEIPS